MMYQNIGIQVPEAQSCYHQTFNNEYFSANMLLLVWSFFFTTFTMQNGRLFYYGCCHLNGYTGRKVTLKIKLTHLPDYTTTLKPGIRHFNLMIIIILFLIIADYA